MIVLLAYSTFSTMSAQVDRWISTIALSRSDLAVYSFAWIVMLVAMSLQAAINASVYPMIARRMALYGREAAYRVTLSLSVSLIAAIAVAFWPAIKLSEFAINRFFPNYSAAIALLPILAVAAACFLSDFWTSFLVITGHERSLLATSIATFCVAVSSWYLVYGSHIDPRNLAYLALAVSVLTYIAVAWRAFFVRS